MLNHRYSATTSDVTNTGFFGQSLGVDVKAGDEIFTNYGSFPMELSWSNFGFSTVEMAVNLGPAFRELMERSLEDPEMMAFGQAHSENVGKQLIAKKCHGIDISAHAGVVGWRLLKRLLQCTRVLFASPEALETMIRREPEEPTIS